MGAVAAAVPLREERWVKPAGVGSECAVRDFRGVAPASLSVADGRLLRAAERAVPGRDPAASTHTEQDPPESDQQFSQTNSWQDAQKENGLESGPADEVPPHRSHPTLTPSRVGFMALDIAASIALATRPNKSS